jgi:HK97 family phage prohead protease
MKINYREFDPKNPALPLTREIIVKTAPVTDAGDGDFLDIKASDQTPDRYGEVIQAAGWQLANYRKNPVIQNAHKYDNLLHTIGKAVRTDVVGNDLIQRWQFASDINPVAKIASGLYRGGYLNACSVGFIPQKWTNAEKQGDPSRTYTQCELLEVSAVGIPANPNALTLAFEAGAIEKSDLRELYALLKHFCSDEPAGAPGNASNSTGGAHELQLLQLVRETAQMVKRA